MQFVAECGGGAIVVDYAHTPDALATVLAALRPHARGRLVALFGCGGDRDAGKRPMMGGAAARLADRVYVTDDNPRGEEPWEIRRAILAAAPEAIEIGDRRQAIAAAIAELGPGDVLLIAGKGHETGQIVGSETHPFDDAEIARDIAAGRPVTPLWTAAAAAAATGGANAADWAAAGVSIDTRTFAAGDLFVALRGPNLRRPRFRRRCRWSGAPPPRWSTATSRGFPRQPRCCGSVTRSPG